LREIVSELLVKLTVTRIIIDQSTLVLRLTRVVIRLMLRLRLVLNA